MSGPVSEEVTSSWLMMKRGGLMSVAFWTWKRRFVKIEGEQLLLYADDGPGAEFKGTVPVRGISVALARAKNATKGGALYAFNTTEASGATIAWAAFSRDERARWLRALVAHGATLEAGADTESNTADEEEESTPGHDETEHALDTASSASSTPAGLPEKTTPSGPGVVYSRMPLSSIFGERGPAQAWDGKPPKRSSPSSDVEGWPRGEPAPLPSVGARRLVGDDAATTTTTTKAAEASFMEVGSGACHKSEAGILRRAASSGGRSSASRASRASEDPSSGSSSAAAAAAAAAAQHSQTTKTVRFDKLAKRGELMTSPSFSTSAADSPGSTRSANTLSSSVSTTPVSRGQAAGKRVVGQWLSKETHLGSGTFGNVYRGTYFNQKVAIKELIVQDLSSESIAEFEREAELHYHLRHNNVILLLCYNVDPANGPTCMVMELAQCSLYDVLHKGVALPAADDRELNIHTRLRILEDVASGLMFLHTLDIMHLDLKSLNLLLDAAGVVKLADFGLSVVKSEIEGSEGKAIGSLPYMAPELMVDEPVPDKSCDVYSFYVVIWEVICRAQPHEGKPPAWIMKFSSKRKKRLDVPKHVGCPERLEALMIRCAEFEPTRRPTMEACQRAISDVRADPVAPSLMRVELPENALFTCQVVASSVDVLDAPHTKLDDEQTFASIIMSSSDLSSRSEMSSSRADSDKTEDSAAAFHSSGGGGLEMLDTPRSAGSTTGHGSLANKLVLSRGDKFYVEAHVAAANARDDGEDQVYLKLANEEAYIAAFGPDGEILVKLVDSSIGAERLAVEARERGIGAVIEGLLFHLATMHAEAVLRLLACIFEILAAPDDEEENGGADDDEAAMSDAMRVKACRRVVASLAIFSEDAHVQLAGVSAVVNLALDAVGRGALAKFGACAAVVSALRTHGQRGDRAFELQRVCAEAILNLLSDDTNAPALKAAGAACALLRVVEGLVRAQEAGTRSSAADVRRRERRVAARAWTSLARLASAEPRPRASSSSSKSNASAASNASHFLASAAASPPAPSTLRPLAAAAPLRARKSSAASSFSSSSTALSRFANVGEADDVPALLRDFNAARLTVLSADDAAKAIADRNANSAAFDPDDDEEEDDNAVVIIDEVEAVSSSLEAPAAAPNPCVVPPDDNGRGASSLLSACCHAMQSFATMPTRGDVPPLSDALLDAGAARTLERALRCALENSVKARRLLSRNGLLEADDLARRACAAIMALAAASSRARMLLGEVGVCEAAVDVARDICFMDPDAPRDDNGRLRYYAVGALSNLAFSAPYNRERLDNAGALQAIAACAEAASDDLDQQRLCCRAFCTLGTIEVSDDADDPRRLEDKHLAVVTQAMLSYDDAQLQHLGCAAIINLAAETRHRRALGRVDACEAVTAALKAHPMDARVQEYGFRAAVYLARDDPENRERFYAHGVRRLAASAARLFAGNPAVLAWAQRLQKEL
ncbi:hypothetical protein CTAYLR_006615 [Chrysophaeum taylorii]|uniref:TKL protein kinase n=1 Tax=Chrysophaeum taylorii TaxID=2483200 RepID=A0AAD7UND3_9STRA|nr:hypothetical protein CTAYLR_006615 [Chrysophaeum taylorii]